jgi:predicted N-formylglutamate amidohydrolase
MQRRGPDAPRQEAAVDDAAPFVVLPGRIDTGVVVICDHAGNDLPADYGTLGLDVRELRRHIAYDIGAAGVVRRLALRLGAPAVLTRYSRLLIDCNRGLDDPTLIMRLSDGAIIPANRHLDAAERERRITSYYTPYHGAIERLIDAALALGVPPLLLSVHSFTDVWKEQARPWHAGVLWDKDPRLAQRLIAALAHEPGWIVGDNEPYSGDLKGDSMWRHGTMRGLPHALIEIRQDLIAGEAGQEEWGDRLADVLAGLLAQDDVARDLRRQHHYGSHTD